MVLLQADWVLPISSPPISCGGVFVKNGSIVAVGDARLMRRDLWAEHVMEFPGCVLMPGLINVHTHLEYSAFRGLLPATGFGLWMLGLLRARRRLDLEDYAASALWGAHECVRSGVTTVADTTYEGAIVARAARAAGLRARVYVEAFGLDDAKLPEAMRRLEERVDAVRRECEKPSGEEGDPGSPAVARLVEPGVSPHAPYTVSARLYREVARLARHAKLPLATHLAESQAEVDLLKGKSSPISRAYQAANLWTGQNWTPPRMSPVRYVAQTGALGPGSLAVHVVQADADDIAVLAATGAGVAHCPRSNTRLQCGSAPLAELIEAGIPVGLGTDSLASNDSLDLFVEMRAALAMSQARAESGVVAPLTPEGALSMATLEGARAAGLDGLVGSIEMGKRADLIAVRLPTLEDEISDPLAQVVRQTTAADVLMTMIDGDVVFEAAKQPAMPDEVVAGLSAARRKLSAGA